MSPASYLIIGIIGLIDLLFIVWTLKNAKTIRYEPPS